MQLTYLLLCSLVVVITTEAKNVRRSVGASSKFSVACPQLHYSKICTRTNAGFQYSDGCNTVTCTAEGEGITSFMFCPPPESAKERLYCARLRQRISSQVVKKRQTPEQRPVTCPDLDSSIVCPKASSSFSYNDGCNGVNCAEGGATTLMACPPPTSEADHQFCAKRKAKIESEFGGKSMDTLIDVACPNLDYTTFCTEARKGLQYNDGCNGVTCEGDGLGMSTMKYCDGPKNKAAESYCDNLEKSISQKSQSPVVCEALRHEKICNGAEREGLEYSDGCNKIKCGKDGLDTSTFMMCDEVEMSNPYCSKMQKNLNRAIEKLNPGSQTASRVYQCPDLEPEKVCKAHMNGFLYHDGCNSIVCGPEGHVQETTFMMCDIGVGPEAQEFCAARVKEMKEKKSKSKRHRECLFASDICKSPNSSERFYDGCNFCYCSGQGQAACTRRGCDLFYGSDKEFEEKCQRLGAGVVE